MSVVAVPSALVEGFAATWTALAGGRWGTDDIAAGRLVWWEAPDGRVEALPDRMYGLAGATMQQVELRDLPPGVPVNLPPGVSAAEATVHSIGHQLVAGDRATAWASLRRVGRQGVRKARRTGCEVLAEVSDQDYLRVAAAKASRLDGRPPHPDLLPALRSVFGPAAVALVGVAVDGLVVSCVVTVSVEAYGMLIDGASDGSHWDRNPNNLAVWEAVGGLLDRGCERVDYGFSPPGAGDLRFKDHLGGREVPLYRVTRASERRRLPA